MNPRSLLPTAIGALVMMGITSRPAQAACVFYATTPQGEKFAPIVFTRDIGGASRYQGTVGDDSVVVFMDQSTSTLHWFFIRPGVFKSSAGTIDHARSLEALDGAHESFGNDKFDISCQVPAS